MHENDVKSAADKDKKATAELLREETEKLNRWQYDEVNGIRLGVAKIKNKIDAAHKKLFTEKIISRKLALRKLLICRKNMRWTILRHWIRKRQ